jgi:hypothetical protein
VLAVVLLVPTINAMTESVSTVLVMPWVAAPWWKSSKTEASDKSYVVKPTFTAFNPTRLATTVSLALPLKSEPITYSLDTKPTVSFSFLSEERHLLGKKKFVGKKEEEAVRYQDCERRV